MWDEAPAISANEVCDFESDTVRMMEHGPRGDSVGAGISEGFVSREGLSQYWTALQPIPIASK